MPAEIRFKVDKKYCQRTNHRDCPFVCYRVDGTGLCSLYDIIISYKEGGVYLRCPACLKAFPNKMTRKCDLSCSNYRLAYNADNSADKTCEDCRPGGMVRSLNYWSFVFPPDWCPKENPPPIARDF